MAERIRIVIAGFGPDGAERNAEATARALRDAGMEVVYAGPHQTPEQIVRTVVQEDADALAVAMPAGAETSPVRRTVELLAENDASDVVVLVSGSVAEADLAGLEALGVSTVLAPGATMDEIVERLRASVAARGGG